MYIILKIVNKMKKLLFNILWLVFDKIFILLLQFFVGVKIANYYGATLFGQYSLQYL